LFASISYFLEAPLRKLENKDWWNSISIDERASIEKGLKDADSGKLNPHINVRKLYEKWL